MTTEVQMMCGRSNPLILGSRLMESYAQVLGFFYSIPPLLSC